MRTSPRWKKLLLATGLALAGPASASDRLITVDTAGCQTNMAINNAIGQSFKLGSKTLLDTIDVWIRPELYYYTSYRVDLYQGEGGGTFLGSSSQLNLGCLQTNAGCGTAAVADWRAFSFAGQNITLQPDTAYTFKLVRLSQYSGAFAQCGNVYANGIEYWLGYSADSSHDVAFRLSGTALNTSCQDVKNANPPAADGEYTLFIGGDASKPWKAWCRNMAGTPAEYLSLPSTGASLNFSQYTAGYNNSGGTNVRTVFTKVRIDPTTLRVNTSDQAFSTSSGYLTHPYNTPVSSMPYATAMNCDFNSPGLGNVDLRGTPFAVAANQFSAVGWYASGNATYSSNNQVVDLQGWGECGWMAGQGADNPFNDRGFPLQLQYAPLP